ncbi:uncharacterized protein LOC131218083 [Magnolia sinica]|uniref:uncharacterized protein LOC131218083 n=1 Tax=Magnolia sinica TaxID=86752 RepID=UPI00265994D1|nr:uncharacterized protein LOC131218083 [Magnolia sinica]
MDVGNMILGWPLLLDLDVTIFGHSNICTFMFVGKKIRLNPLPPKNIPEKEVTKKGDPDILRKYMPKALHIINAKEFEKENRVDSEVYALMARDIMPQISVELSNEVISTMDEFKDVFFYDLSDELPSMRDIQNVIDLVPKSTLPNLSHYRMNPTKHAELKEQVDELL